MTRVCINCKSVFGCHGYDGTKQNCNTCGEYGSCDTRTMPDPRNEEVTGGICDGCFEHLVIPRRIKLPGGV